VKFFFVHELLKCFISAWHYFFAIQFNLKFKIMADNNKNRDSRQGGSQDQNKGNRSGNIGNQQGTTQTGGQNQGGRNRGDQDRNDQGSRSGNQNQSSGNRGNR
jgi:hypothetical protein